MKRHDCKINEGLIEAMIDGELEESRSRRLEDEIAQCEQCSTLSSSLVEMRAVLQVHSEAVADSTDFGSLWPNLEAQLEADGVFAASLDSLKLQAFADGELEGRELIRVADSVARYKPAHLQLDAIAELGDLLRTRVESVTDTVDFGVLWQKLDSQVGEEIEARGRLPIAEPRESVEQVGWLGKLMNAVGGYRSVILSAVTAAAVVLIMLPIMLSQKGSEPEAPLAAFPEAIEIRVVHVNEVISNAGHLVTVDSHDGYAPVIYIQTEDDARSWERQRLQSIQNGLYDDPI